VYLCVLCGSDNSHYFPIQHQMTGFYNQDGVCLLRGTDCVFKCHSGWFSPLNICDISSCDPETPDSLIAEIKGRLQLLSRWPLRGRGRLLRRLT